MTDNINAFEKSIHVRSIQFLLSKSVINSWISSIKWDTVDLIA